MTFVGLTMAGDPVMTTGSINRTFKEGEVNQFLRELPNNSITHGQATELIIDMVRLRDPNTGKPSGPKIAFIDNGVGMSGTELQDFFVSLFKTGGTASTDGDGNFAMGSRVATLPANKHGILVASWTPNNPFGSLLRLRFDEPSRTYVYERAPDGRAYSRAPAWMKHPIIAKSGHGTIIILLGDSHECNTFGLLARKPDGSIDYPTDKGERTNRGLWNFLNSKFVHFGRDDVSVKLRWPGEASAAKWIKWLPVEQWLPETYKVGTTTKASRREITGVDAKVAQVAVNHPSDTFFGSVHVTAKVHGVNLGATAHWALLPEEVNNKTTAKSGGSKDTVDHGIRLGLFGERYTGHDGITENYNMNVGADAKSYLAKYGIAVVSLQERIIIMVEPDASNLGCEAAAPNGARSRLRVIGADLPHEEWGQDFISKMPTEISARLSKILSKSVQLDEEKLQEKQRKEQEFLTDVLAPKRPARKGETGVITPFGAIKSTGSTTKRTRKNPPNPNPNPNPNPKPSKPRGGTTGRQTGPVVGEGDSTVSAVPASHKRPERPTVIPVGPDVMESQYPAMYFRNDNTLWVNESHPLILQNIKLACTNRPAHAHDMAREAVIQVCSELWIENIMSGMYYESLATGNSTLDPGDKFFETMSSPNALLSMIISMDNIQSKVNNRFRGKAGLKLTA